MSVIRSFIAIEITPEIQERLQKVVDQLQVELPEGVVRWVPATNMHLTLKFLGDVSLANLDILKEILQSEAGHHKPFEISVGSLGAFPSARRARVIWTGVQAPAELSAIQNGIENEMARLGYAREERAFSAHLTLGRVVRNAPPEDVRQLGDVLSKTKVGYLGAAMIRQIQVFQSDLRPEGAVYTRLFSAPLRGV